MVEIPVMATTANIQEDRIVDVAVVIGWVLDMIAVQNMDMVAVQSRDMVVVATNLLQEVNSETAAPVIGELVVVIGEPVAMKVVVTGVDIQKTSIWVEVKAGSAATMMIIIVPAEVKEVEAAELLILANKVTQDLRAGAAAAAAIGN